MENTYDVDIIVGEVVVGDHIENVSAKGALPVPSLCMAASPSSAVLCRLKEKDNESTAIGEGEHLTKLIDGIPPWFRVERLR